MVWEHLSVNRPHLVYIILGGFTSIFMLCSLFIKEKLYIGEATVATICGIIFGPSAANLINPLEWGNPDKITLEFSRIVLVVQCFAIGVELPKNYMERHWKSVVFLLVPVMTYGWLVTSLFIWWMIEPLTWLESLICAACVTATDPVLASSVVGKGKFAKRIPKHLRDILSAESGCNDGMAFPFIYLAVYIARYRPSTEKVAFHWICYTILYECIFGAIYGIAVGYSARHAIKLAEKKGLIDRESFLVFYFVLALFCAGSGSMLGMDDLLIGFSAGVGFSNDGWFTEKTEESHVSNVIDLLLNLTYFVYFGTIIPWNEFNAPEYGMVPWKLVVLGIFVLLFRRIPIMMLLKPVIPDIKTWREALFAGHFGPIGVGAIFVAILARAELETDSTDPLSQIPPPGSKDFLVIYLIWPITCFLVILSIAIHGSSIAVFTLGKRINTLTLSLSYTQDNDAQPNSWMDRVPRLSKSGSKANSVMETTSLNSESNEKLPFPPGTLGPTGFRGNFLRRQKDETEKPGTAPMGRSRKKNRSRDRRRLGGPVSESAIGLGRRPGTGTDTPERAAGEKDAERVSGEVSPESPTSIDSDKLDPSQSTSTSTEREGKKPQEVEVYDEGGDIVVEDQDGNVLSANTEDDQITEAEHTAKTGVDDDGKATQGEQKDEDPLKANPEADTGYKNLKKQFGHWKGWGRAKEGEAGQSEAKEKPEDRRRGAARAYQYGNTIIVEDEDGEVLKTFNVPSPAKHEDADHPEHGWRKMSNAAEIRRGLSRVGTWAGMAERPAGPVDAARPTPSPQNTDGVPAAPAVPGTPGVPQKGSVARHPESTDFFGDSSLRFTISHIDRHGHGLSGASGTSRAAGVTSKTGRRYSTADFVKEIQQMDPRSQLKAIDASTAPEQLKNQMRRVAEEGRSRSGSRSRQGSTTGRRRGSSMPSYKPPSISDDPKSRSVSPERRPSLRQTASGTDFEIPRALLADGPSDPSPSGSGSSSSPRRRPSPTRLPTTTSTITEADEPDRPIPTHNVAATVSKYHPTPTAADARRQRLIQPPNSAPLASTTPSRWGQRETSAEQRRRIAALEGGSESDSDTEDEEGPRRVPTRPREAMAPEPKPRVQWGGEKGREEEAEREGEEVGGGSGGNGGGGTASGVDTGKKSAIRGLFGRKK